jgi:MYXO-CTERM domain-containing protein
MAMRKTIAAAAITGAVLFGGAGIADATVPAAPASSSTVTVAQDQPQNEQQDSDKTGLWGLLGLLGLGGLAALRRRNDTYRDNRTTGAQGTSGGTIR